MTESEIVKVVVEGLRSISQGVEAIAKKLEDSFTEVKPKAKRTRKPKAKSPSKTKTKKAPGKKAKTATDTVLSIVRRSKKGVSVDTIAEKTGYNKSKIYNILSTLKKLGKIKTVSRGVYTKV